MPVTQFAVLTEDRFEALLRNSEFLIEEVMVGDMDASEAVSTLIVEMSFLLPEHQADRLRSALVAGRKAAEELRMPTELDDVELGVALVRGTVEESYRRRHRPDPPARDGQP